MRTVLVIQRFFYCWIFLTKLPCVPLPKASKEDWGRIAPYFVLVGYILGLILFFLSKLFIYFKLPIMFSALLIVLTWELITGGLHLDGLMDTFDGINCQDPERKMEAMKDSRVGAFGAMAGIFLILFKLVTLCTILANKIFFVILFALPFARLMAVYSFTFLAQNKKSGVSSSLLLAGVKKPQDFLINLIIFILPVLFCSTIHYPLSTIHYALSTICYLLSAICLFSILVAHWLNNHFKGHSGDTFGALVEMSEVIFLSLFVTLKNYS